MEIQSTKFMKFILGKKIGMTQTFIDDKVVPVTLISAGPVVVSQIKTKEKDGYESVQVGFEEQKEKRLSKAIKNHLKELGSFRYLREFRVDKIDDYKRGDIYDVSAFVAGDIVRVSGSSKAKGFQGVVKRHGFAGGPATHGQKDRLRAPGSIGGGGRAGGRVVKGMKMAGRMGNDRKTLKKVKIVFADKEQNLLAVKGQVPGRRGTLLEIFSI